MNLNKMAFLLFILSCVGINNPLSAQKDSAATAKDSAAGVTAKDTTAAAPEEEPAAIPIVKLHYFNNNNSVQYVLLESNLKKGKVFTPQKGKTYDIYLDSSTADKLIAKVQTDGSGKAKAFLPPSVKATWDATPQHTFVVKEGDEEVITDYIITKSKITLDTVNTDGAKSITITVMQLDKTNKWIPAKDVEMKVGIARLGSILSAGDEQSYTTDANGVVTAELKKDSLPGDKNGNLILTAKVEDNELLGNLVVEKTANWGVPTIEDTNFFNQRTLWTTRFRTPYWLLFMAYSIIIGVWGTLIYLIRQLLQIKKLGKTAG